MKRRDLRELDLSLIDWSDGRPRLLGRLRDADLVEAARARLELEQRQRLADLLSGRGPRLVRDDAAD